MLDHLLPELERRFTQHQKTTLEGQYLVPSVLVAKDLATVSSAAMKVGELYSVDHPNMSSLEAEIHNWHTKWTAVEKDHGFNALPTTLSSTLLKMSIFFPNIKALITILCTLPVTSCIAERSFSGLKRVKTNLQSAMFNERLSNLTLLHIHQDIPVNIEEVID